MLCEIELIQPVINKYINKRPVHNLALLKDMIENYGFEHISLGNLLVVYNTNFEEVFRFNIKAV